MDTQFNILGFGVIDQLQGHGIGKSLLAELEYEARRRGYAGIRLNTGIERKDAHQFYLKRDYQNDKTQFRFRKIFTTDV